MLNSILNEKGLIFTASVLAFLSMGCSEVNPTAPKIVTTTPVANASSTITMPSQITFYFAGDNIPELVDPTESRYLARYYGDQSDYINKFYPVANLDTLINDINDVYQKIPFLKVDSSSGCTPTLTLNKEKSKLYQSVLSIQPPQLTFDLSGGNCEGKTLTLKYFDILTLNDDRNQPYDSSSKCDQTFSFGNSYYCQRYQVTHIYSRHIEAPIQTFNFKIGGATTTLSAACTAINNIGAFTLSGSSAMRVDPVGTLATGETVSITYTASGASPQSIIRWLDSGGTQIDPPIVSPTASGSQTGLTPPANATQIRTYVVGGTWTVQYSCYKN
ncbi:MAG: hypothetical protein ACXVCY_12345 [Pseudobdellovibrionaceae bacterium]